MSDPSVTRQILLTLVDVSVKTAVFAVAAELLLRLVDRRDTRLRHAAWVAVLCGMLALPLSLFFPGLPLRLPSLPLAADVPAAVPPAPVQIAASAAPPALAGPAHVPAPVRHSAAIRPPAPPPPAAARARLSWPQLLIGIYLVGLLFMAGRLLLGLFLRRRVLATARPVAHPALDALCGRLSARAGLRSLVSVRESRAVRVPLAIGGRRHLVVLPDAWSTWESAKLESVLAHELAHLRRADPWIHLLGLVNRCIYWFHPVAWVIPRHLSGLAERICDEMAVSWTGRRRGYARHLVEITAALQGREGRVVLAGMPMAARTSDLRERVESLLDGAPQRRLGQIGRSFVILVISGIVLTVGAVRVEAEKPARQLKAGERKAAVGDLSSADAGKRAGAARKLREAEVVTAEEVPALVRMLGDRAPAKVRMDATNPGTEAAQALGEAGEIAVAPLREALGSASPEVRRDAAYALGITLSPQAVQPLLSALRDPAWQVRERAAWALGTLKSPEAVQPLVAALSDENAEVRAMVARGLGLIGDREALAALEAAGQDSSEQVRSRAARAVELIEARRAAQGLTETEKQSVAELRTALRHADYRVRLEAVEALTRSGDPAGVADLIAALKDADYRVREASAGALGEVGDRAALEALAVALADERYSVRQRAARALGLIGDPAAIAPLTSALRDPDHRVRQAAAEALGWIGGPEAFEGLGRALRDEQPEVRMEAILALISIDHPEVAEALGSARDDRDQRIRRHAELAAQAVKGSASLAELEAALTDDDYRLREAAAAAIEREGLRGGLEALLRSLREDTSAAVRETAARALGTLDDPRATPALMLALQDESWEVRQQAASSLGRLGDPQATQALTAALADEHPRVRAQAAEALRRLGSAG